MLYTQDITRAFNPKDDLSRSRYENFLSETTEGVGILRARQKDNSWPVLNIGERSEDIPAIKGAAKRIAAHYDTLIVVGMGGSSRGGRTLCALADNPFARRKTDILFLENIDPATMDTLIASVDLKGTMFLLISKSGDTAETLAQALILIDAVSGTLGEKAVREHFMAITEPKDSALRRLAETHGIHLLDHDPAIGGRFAALTNVGLLPAKVAGLDIHAIRKGAGDVMRHTITDASPEPARGAALSLCLAEAKRSIAVLMPYCDRLQPFGLWWEQLWGESLGKKGVGTTPLAALGATDQHSQLQLYLSGPPDKFFSLLLLAQANKGPLIPPTGDKSLGYMNARTLGDLMDAEQRATAETLAKNNQPLRVFTLPTLNEETLGALMMHFMIETILAAHLYQINAFDQPAVEEGKKLAREYMARK